MLLQIKTCKWIRLVGGAAFGPNGELLGVVGLDFFERKIQESYSTIQWQSIVEEAKKHDPGRTFNTLTDLSTNVCFNKVHLVCPIAQCIHASCSRL